MSSSSLIRQFVFSLRNLNFIIFSFFLLSLSVHVTGQCIVRGKVIDNNGEIPIGATVYLKLNNTIGTVTDINGNYELKLNSPGPQVMVVSYIGYNKIEDTVSCNGNNIVIKNFILEPQSVQLSNVTIVGKVKHSSDIHMESIKKVSSNSIDYISAETLKKTVDANIAAAITRVAGVSSTSNGFITVRGIGDRYLKTTINGSWIPTLDPLTNNIKIDLFPASLVDNIVIAKTASPDLPGDWAGAYISIETKQFPEAFALNVETSLGYNTQSTFKDYLSSQKSSTDWLGFDNDFREFDHNNYIQFNDQPTTYDEFIALGLGDYFKNLGITSSTPWNDTYFKLGLIELGLLGKAQFDDQAAFDNAKSQYNTMYYREHAFNLLNTAAVKSEKSMANTWKSITKQAPLNFSQSFSVGDQTNLFKRTLGYLAGFRYSSSVQYDPDAYGNRFGIENKIIEGKASGCDLLTQPTSKENNGWSALLGVSYKITPNNTISLLFMPNVTGVNSVKDLKTMTTIGSDSGVYIRRTYQTYESRKQMIYQLSTDHFLSGTKIKITSDFSYTVGRSNLPDLRVTPDQPYGTTRENSPVYILGNSIGTGRYYRYLSEDVFDSKLITEIPLDEKAGIIRKIKLGGSFQLGNRRQDNYYYQLTEGNGSEYIQAANPDADPYGIDRFDIVTILNHSLAGNHGDSLCTVQQYYERATFPNNHIFGKSYVGAGFAMIDYSISPVFRFSGGLRVEKAFMFTDCDIFDKLDLGSNDYRRHFVAPSPILDITIRPGKLDEMSFLPSASLIVKLKDDDNLPINLRFNFSKTVARPSLRELSDNAYFDYEINKVVYGNSSLEMVRINNFDLRFEAYLKSGNNFSVSIFYKDFKNHIEVADFGQYLIWINNKHLSWAKGIELEGKVDLFKSLELRANVTLVSSKSSFNTSYTNPDGYLVTGRDVNRTMLNQAPYVINTILTYNAKKAGCVTSISYNIQGPRVISTGSYMDIPDIYEIPRNLVDMKVTKSLGKHYSLSLKIMDILSTSIVRAYRIENKYNLVFDSYHYGTSYTIAFSYKI